MYFGIKEIQANFDDLMKHSSDLGVKRLSSSEVELGLEASKQATRLPGKVPMSPYAKHGLKMAGDIKDGEDLLVGSKITRFEKWLTDTCNLLLLKESKVKLEGYNDRLPILDYNHYLVDCYHNLSLDNWRPVRGQQQVDELNEKLCMYEKPSMGGEVAYLLRADPLFQKSVEVVCNEIPDVVASSDIVDVNLPFMTKHTNVGYPYWRNDKTVVPNKGITYAQLTLHEAERYKNDPAKAVADYNVSTEFARYNKKGRLLIAPSRIMNLVFNQLESQEIAAYKVKSSLFAGYESSYNKIKPVLEDMANYAITHDLIAHNFDYHLYDLNVTKEGKTLAGAQSMFKAKGSRSKDIAYWRTLAGLKTPIVAGTMDRVMILLGRIFSGEIDTNRGGGVNNANTMTYLLSRQDEHYFRNMLMAKYRMLVMGDDNCCLHGRNLSLPLLTKEAKKYFNAEIDDLNKIAFGIQFLQIRLFEVDGIRHISYPWTRVVKSSLFKERASNLMNAGWTLATYQNAAKLIDWLPALSNYANIMYYLDEDKLMLDRSVHDIIEQSKKEDKLREEKLGRMYRSTADSLYDGDPNKADQFLPNGELNPSYFEVVQAELKKVVNNNFFKLNGLHTL